MHTMIMTKLSVWVHIVIKWYILSTPYECRVNFLMVHVDLKWMFLNKLKYTISRPPPCLFKNVVTTNLIGFGSRWLIIASTQLDYVWDRYFAHIRERNRTTLLFKIFLLFNVIRERNRTTILFKNFLLFV